MNCLQDNSHSCRLKFQRLEKCTWRQGKTYTVWPSKCLGTFLQRKESTYSQCHHSRVTLYTSPEYTQCTVPRFVQHVPAYTYMRLKQCYKLEQLPPQDTIDMSPIAYIDHCHSVENYHSTQYTLCLKICLLHSLSTRCSW